MHQRQRLGAAGEELAAAYLTDIGCQILHRNWRPTLAEVRGELDIIVRDGDWLAVVEVRTRRSDRAGSAIESVGREKRRRLRLLCAAYQYEESVTGAVRGDVIAIQAPVALGDDSTGLRHLRGVW